MVQELFVYGTLMQHTDSAMARFLHSRAVSLGMAKVPGRLYDLGSYPGAVYDPGEKRWITGQVYSLHCPSETFPILDQYEGVADAPPVPTEYIRILAAAQLHEQTISCWIYHYHRETRHLPLIDSGNYLDYYMQQNTHRDFIVKGR